MQGDHLLSANIIFGHKEKHSCKTRATTLEEMEILWVKKYFFGKKIVMVDLFFDFS